MASFETYGFDSQFAIKVDPEFPGNGDWGCSVVGFARDGHRMEPFDSRWGTPLVVRIEPEHAPTWVAMLAAGGLGGLRGAFGTPRPRSLLVVVDGLAYLLDVDHPEAPATIIHDQVHQVAAVDEPLLLLVVRFIDIVAIGANGIAWTTPRLCVDGLTVRSVGPKGVICECDNLGGIATIVLDPHTGAQIDGTRLDALWPPDALA